MLGKSRSQVLSSEALRPVTWVRINEVQQHWAVGDSGWRSRSRNAGKEGACAASIVPFFKPALRGHLPEAPPLVDNPYRHDRGGRNPFFRPNIMRTKYSHTGSGDINALVGATTDMPAGGEIRGKPDRKIGGATATVPAVRAGQRRGRASTRRHWRGATLRNHATAVGKRAVAESRRRHGFSLGNGATSRSACRIKPSFGRNGAGTGAHASGKFDGLE